jgi:hypothetical protein
MKKSTAAKDTMISARVPASVKEAAERAAADDRRSLASLVEIALVEYLRPKGYLDPEEVRPVTKPKGKGQ